MSFQSSKIYMLANSSMLQKYNVLRMYYQRFVKKNVVVPGISICPSYVCQLNCKHCCEEKMDDSVCLTTGEIKKIIDDFYRDLYGFQAVFCSGEVLLREDLIELIRYLYRKGFFTIVVTNGLLLTSDKIKELKKAGLTRLAISIDHPDEKKHDYLRGMDGCYQKAMFGIRESVKQGINTVIWTYVSKFNENDLEVLGDIANNLGVTEVKVYFPALSGKLDISENLTLSQREKYREIANKNPILRLELMKESSRCRGGREFMAVLPSGDITPCIAVQSCNLYGNIRKDSLKESFMKMKKDCYYFNSKFTGQCMINNPEYREKVNNPECREKVD